MPTTMINVRVDENVKKEVEELYYNLGFNISIAVNMLFRQSLLEKAFPFQPKIKFKHKTLKERLKDFKGEYTFEEWSTGESVGSEIIE